MARSDNDLFDRFFLAEKLHKTVAEVDALSVNEFNGWFAYFSAKESRREKG